MCILFVDDETLIADLALEVRTGHGYRVEVCYSAVMARHLIKIRPFYYFTFLVTDFHMPIESGGNLIEHMRPLYPEIPIVLATANGAAVTQGWRIKHNVTLLAKPYGGRDLVSVVKRLFSEAAVQPD